MNMRLPRSSVAKKYARAIMTVFGAQLSLEQVRCCVRIADYCIERPRMMFYARISCIEDTVKKTYFMQLKELYKVGDFFQSLVDLLLTTKRIELLPDVLRHLFFLYLEREHITLFEITAAHELPAHEIAVIQDFLARKVGKTLVTGLQVDSSLIAGIQALSTTYRWEHSVRRQLERLETLLIF